MAQTHGSVGSNPTEGTRRKGNRGGGCHRGAGHAGSPPEGQRMRMIKKEDTNLYFLSLDELDRLMAVVLDAPSRDWDWLDRWLDRRFINALPGWTIHEVLQCYETEHYWRHL